MGATWFTIQQKAGDCQFFFEEIYKFEFETCINGLSGVQKKPAARGYTGKLTWEG